MAENSGRTSLIGAVIVGVAVVAGAAIIANGLSRVTAQLDKTTLGLEEIKKAVADVKGSLVAAARPAPAAAPQPARRRGPDPNKRHTINLAGAQAKGPATAKIKLVEFSDFQ